MVTALIVGMGEDFAACGEGVEVRGFDFGIATEADGVVGEIVGEDEEEVGLLSGDRVGAENCVENESEGGDEISHGWRSTWHELV